MTEKEINQKITDKITKYSTLLDKWVLLQKRGTYYKPAAIEQAFEILLKEEEDLHNDLTQKVNQLLKEKQELLDLLEETAIRTNLTLPKDEEQEKWFKERTQKQWSFKNKLLKTIGKKV
jgi:hypothetical protein